MNKTLVYKENIYLICFRISGLYFIVLKVVCHLNGLISYFPSITTLKSNDYATLMPSPSYIFLKEKTYKFVNINIRIRKLFLQSTKKLYYIKKKKR